MQTKRESILSNSGSIQTKPGSIQTKRRSIQTKRGSKLLEPGSIQSGENQSSMFGINSVPTLGATDASAKTLFFPFFSLSLSRSA